MSLWTALFCAGWVHDVNFCLLPQRPSCTLTDPTQLTLSLGYPAVSTEVFTARGYPKPVVTKQSGPAEITWNNETKRIDIAPGLPVGDHPVALKAATGAGRKSEMMFTLTVWAPAALEINPSRMTISPRGKLDIEKNLTIDAWAAPGNSVAWYVSDTKLASIDENGVLTALRVGVVTVVACRGQHEYAVAIVSIRR